MSPRKILCLICGCGEGEAEKFHFFPRNKERCQRWLDAFGYPAAVEDVKYARVCNNHFSGDAYMPDCIHQWTLRKDAVPTSFPPNGKQLPGASSTSTDELESSTSVPDTFLPDPVHIQPSVKPCESLAQSPQPSTSRDVPYVPTKKPIYKGVSGLSKLSATPRKRSLMRMVESKEAHIRQLKRICRKKKDDIKALCDFGDSNVVRNLFSGMNSLTSNFLISQLRCCRRSTKGRRWTIQDKVVALALMKKSPRSYNFLRKIVALPSRRTLLSLLEKVPFTSGINNHQFKHIDASLKTAEDRFCVLLFDEMDLKQNLEYDKSEDRIMGFEDYGDNTESNKVANRALVFTCVGLGAKKWKQPVAYYFSQNGCSSDNLKRCLQEVVTACKKVARVRVVVTLCDMGSVNVKTLKEMGSCVQRPYIEINQERIYTMYDPPHLLKCTVSLFRKHRVILPVEIGGVIRTMEADFQHIVRAHEKDKASPLVFRHLHKIKQEHLDPKMRFAMKVSIAAHIMSHSVGAYLYTLVSDGTLEEGALATATFVQEVDELFDSFNGSSRTTPGEGGKPLKCHMNKDSPHINYWKKSFKMVDQWQFERLTKTGTLKESRPPSQIGWLTTLRAIERTWSALQSNGFTSMRPRSLNQDPLENLFGCIRGACGSGDNPTVVQFKGALKTAILNNLTNQAMAGTNCEEDDHHILSNLTEFLNVGEPSIEPPTQMTTPTDEPRIDSNEVADQIAEAVRAGQSETLSVAYVAGSIVKRLSQITRDCQQCSKDLLCTSEEPHNLFITFKEWSTKENHLVYPTEMVVVLVGHAITVLERVLCENAARKHISEVARTLMYRELTFGFLCDVHRELLTEHFLLSVCRIGIPWWCKRQNRARKDERATARKIKKFRHK